MTQGARPGVPRRTVAGGAGRRGPADLRLRHPARGRRAPRAPRADPHPGARGGRAGRADPRHGIPGRPRRDGARRRRRRPRDHPPPAALRAAHDAAGRAGAGHRARRPDDARAKRHAQCIRGRTVGHAVPARAGVPSWPRPRARRRRRPPRSPGWSPTCGPRWPRCTRSGTPPRPSSPDARRPCPSTRSAVSGWRPWRPRRRPPVYFLEVVAARSTGRQRDRADTTLAALRALRVDQLAGGAVPDDVARSPPALPGRRRRRRRAAGPAGADRSARRLRGAPRAAGHLRRRRSGSRP